MSTTELIVETLGGARALRSRPATPGALRDRVREGLPYASLDAVAKRLELTSEEITRIIGLPPRTLARRKASHRLRAEESDRLYRLSRIASLAEEVLGDSDKAKRWLHAPNRALGHETPLGFLDTDLGVRQVEAVLGRIAHGVHS
jgi:putative toxin-antitoxin system antitoxin component (TIGR02293 family)